MVAAIVFAAAMSATPAAAFHMHPLHTTLSEVTIDRTRGTVRVVVRVFADDFGTALEAMGRTGSWSERAAAYVHRAISIADDAHQPIAMRDCGTRQQGDLLWLCSEATVGARTAHLSLRDQMLCDLFADQVNVVRVTDGIKTRSMLFTRGDPEKSLST